MHTVTLTVVKSLNQPRKQDMNTRRCDNVGGGGKIVNKGS